MRMRYGIKRQKGEKMMSKKIMAILVGVFMAGTIYSGMCLLCIADHNTVSEEDYACMAQQLVEQSIQP